MSKYKYSATVNEHRARAVGLLMPISIKQSIEICNLIRGKNLQKAKKILNEAKDMKKPIPFTRFTEGAGHKHGIGPGKYPVKACSEILKLISLVESNAQHKGLDTSSLEIIHICANQGPKSWHYGRQSRIKMKRNHIEVVVEEKEIKKKVVKKEPAKKEESKPVKKQEEKTGRKKEEKPKAIKQIEKVEKKQDIKTKPAEEKPSEAKTKNKVEEKKDKPKKEQPKENVPAAELAEKAKPKKVPAINKPIKKKESEVDKK